MKNPFHEGTQYRCSGDPETLRHGRRSGDYRRSARSDFGPAAGEGFKGCASLMITVAAIMVLFPRMIRLIVEGLLPISDGARKFFQKYFKGREVYIGLDTAVTLGHPTTIAVGLLLIPIMLILASILPGNKVLPLADLPVAPFFICMATVIHRGDRSGR